MQQNLLDTHTLIWFIDGSNELSQIARQTIEADDTDNYVSIGSLWEIAIKISLDKLELKTPFNQVGRQIIENGFEFYLLLLKIPYLLLLYLFITKTRLTGLSFLKP